MNASAVQIKPVISMAHTTAGRHSKRSVSVTVNVEPFVKGRLALGFTRGFTQSQAFVHHFSKDASIAPAKRTLVYDTKKEAGANAQGVKYSYADEYEWMGFTARDRLE